jgi:hypothetical protein
LALKAGFGVVVNFRFSLVGLAALRQIKSAVLDTVLTRSPRFWCEFVLPSGTIFGYHLDIVFFLAQKVIAIATQRVFKSELST